MHNALQVHGAEGFAPWCFVCISNDFCYNIYLERITIRSYDFVVIAV